MFPETEASNETDSALDRLVVSMSADLIDDFPASDPRWLKTVPAAEASGGVGSTMSLLILHQLEDKQTALEVYISFLKEVGLWKRVGTCPVASLISGYFITVFLPVSVIGGSLKGYGHFDNAFACGAR